MQQRRQQRRQQHGQHQGAYNTNRTPWGLRPPSTNNLMKGKAMNDQEKNLVTLEEKIEMLCDDLRYAEENGDWKEMDEIRDEILDLKEKLNPTNYNHKENIMEYTYCSICCKKVRISELADHIATKHWLIKLAYRTGFFESKNQNRINTLINELTKGNSDEC